MLSITVTPSNLTSHLFHISLSVDARHTSMDFYMPAWTTGSYTVRDYAGRVRRVSAYLEHSNTERETLALNKTSKNTWHLNVASIKPCDRFVIEYDVFAYSMGIHDAWLDEDRAFFNPAALFILPEGRNEQECPVELTLNAPTGFSDWQAKTTLTPVNVLPSGFGRYRAKNTEHLLDSPVTMAPQASLLTFSLNVLGTPHEFVFSGFTSENALNIRKLETDLSNLLLSVAHFWAPDSKELPFKHYIFHVHAGNNLFGGLEHSDNCVLLTHLAALPAAFENAVDTEEYQDFLRLVAHEYFHAWLVKRIRPTAFIPYRQKDICYTEDLWIFEGITSYYESVLPKRAGLISDEAFLALIAKRFDGVLNTPGVDEMTLSEASFDAWIKLYHPSADSPYSQTSYYGKGAIAAFILDAEIRAGSHNQFSLQSVLQSLWRNWITQKESYRGITNKTFADEISTLTGLDLHCVIELLTKNTHAENFRRLFDRALMLCGAVFVSKKDTPAALRLAGLRTQTTDGAKVLVRFSYPQSPALVSGLYNGDELLAIDDLRVNTDNLNRLIERAQARSVRVTFFRNDRLKNTTLSIPSPGETWGEHTLEITNNDAPAVNILKGR